MAMSGEHSWKWRQWARVGRRDGEWLGSGRWLTVLCAVLTGFSHDRLFATLWTIAHQAPLSMGFSRPEHWSGSPFPPPGDLPDPGIELEAPAVAGRFFTAEPPCQLYMLARPQQRKTWKGMLPRSPKYELQGDREAAWLAHAFTLGT